MSDNPLLSKMDALLKKHRGGIEDTLDVPTPEQAATPTAPPGAWLPVLTQVIERGTAPVASAPVAPPASTPSVAVAPSTLPEVPTADAPIADAPAPTSSVSDTLTEQLMSELGPRLSEVMEKQVAAELRKNLDETVASLLSQLDVNVREIVRDAVAEKLKKPHDPST